jgi:hypothetical protein
MSSGSYTSPGLGFCNTGKPTSSVLTCASIADEPRGTGIYFTGLCVLCGVATTSREPGGRPRHHPFRQPHPAQPAELTGDYPAPGIYLATPEDAALLHPLLTRGAA